MAEGFIIIESVLGGIKTSPLRCCVMILFPGLSNNVPPLTTVSYSTSFQETYATLILFIYIGNKTSLLPSSFFGSRMMRSIPTIGFEK